MQATETDIRDLSAIGIVASTGCDYFAEIGFPDVLEIGLAASRIGTSASPTNSSLPRRRSDLRALGYFVHVYVDARRATPCQSPIRSGMPSSSCRESTGRRPDLGVIGSPRPRSARPAWKCQDPGLPC